MIRPKIIELGTHSGGFAFLAFCQAVQRLGLPTACYAIDIWAEDERFGCYAREVYDQLAAINAQHCEDFAQLMHSSFNEALPHFGEGTVDLLPIDGRRGYPEASTVFETWQPKLSTRTVVLRHDTSVRDREFGVWCLWAELLRQYRSFEFLHGRSRRAGIRSGDAAGSSAAVRSFCRTATDDPRAWRVPSARRALNDVRQERKSLAHRHQAECGRLQSEQGAVWTESRRLQTTNDH